MHKLFFFSSLKDWTVGCWFGAVVGVCDRCILVEYVEVVVEVVLVEKDEVASSMDVAGTDIVDTLGIHLANTNGVKRIINSTTTCTMIMN